MATLNVPTGLLKAILLKEASRAPLSAVTLIKRISERTDGLWQPSPGSIYYLTNELETKNYLKKLEVENERYPKYIITPKGQEEFNNIINGSNKDILKLVKILILYSDVIENRFLKEELDKLYQNFNK
ncbi:MAG: PadR family transcriptional regulator [Nitrososphaeria archaeon]|jgi:DNA-binding PadR family transcriptional regulator